MCVCACVSVCVCARACVCECVYVHVSVLWSCWCVEYASSSLYVQEGHADADNVSSAITVYTGISVSTHM